jgi:hypothetical protein
VALNPLITVTVTEAKMEAVIRDTTIESLHGLDNPTQNDGNRGSNLSEYQFLLTCRSDKAALRYRYFLTQPDSRLRLAQPNRPV